MLYPKHAINTLAQEVLDGKWERKKYKFSLTDVLDFLKTNEELKIFSQAQAVSYLSKIMEDDNCIKILYFKINDKIKSTSNCIRLITNKQVLQNMSRTIISLNVGNYNNGLLLCFYKVIIMFLYKCYYNVGLLL